MGEIFFWMLSVVSPVTGWRLDVVFVRVEYVGQVAMGMAIALRPPTQQLVEMVSDESVDMALDLAA